MTTRTDSSESFQIPIEIAEHYEAAFVPAFFTQWASSVCDRAQLRDGHAVLDVACGTGVVTRLAAERVGPAGSAVGVDLNEAMLTVARRVQPDGDWRQGDAHALPFEDESFDAVTCQMAMMFFHAPTLAFREMRRVVRPGGRVVVAVPSELEAQAAFLPFVEMAVRHAGPEAESLLTTYFARGRVDELAGLATAAGLTVEASEVLPGTYRAPDVPTFVTTEVESTPLVERLTDEVYGRIKRDAVAVLAPFTTADGRVEAPFQASVVTAVR